MTLPHGRSDAVNKLERFQEDFLGGDDSDDDDTEVGQSLASTKFGRYGSHFAVVWAIDVGIGRT
jgi:hypothetical protein